MFNKLKGMLEGQLPSDALKEVIKRTVIQDIEDDSCTYSYEDHETKVLYQRCFDIVSNKFLEFVDAEGFYTECFLKVLRQESGITIPELLTLNLKELMIYSLFELTEGDGHENIYDKERLVEELVERVDITFAMADDLLFNNKDASAYESWELPRDGEGNFLLRTRAELQKQQGPDDVGADGIDYSDMPNPADSPDDYRV